MKLISAFLFLTLTAFAWSGEIIQPQSTGSWNIELIGPIWQTFTAVDSRISTIGFYVNGGASSSPPPTTTLTYELLQGAGTSGPLLATSSVTLSSDFIGYADVSFASVTLSVGQVYTAMISANTANYAVWWNDHAPAYPRSIDYTGGEAIDLGQLLPQGDLTFRIEPLPEPAALTLFLAGGFILFGRSGVMSRRQARSSGN
jgi:hypothetical protein